MIVWMAATLLAFYVKGLCGFANTLLFNSIMNFADSAVNISPVELLLSFPGNAIMVWRERRELRLRIFGPPTAMMLLGSAAGAFLLKSIDASAAKVFFGVVVIALGVEMLLRERGVKKAKSSPVALAAVGVLSGVLCGLFGVGALLAAYMNRTTDSSGAFRANMCAGFMADDVFRILLYAALGIINAAALRQALLLSPFMLLGLFLGMKSGRIVDEKKARRIVVLLLIVSGAALIAQNL